MQERIISTPQLCFVTQLWSQVCWARGEGACDGTTYFSPWNLSSNSVFSNGFVVRGVKNNWKKHSLSVHWSTLVWYIAIVTDIWGWMIGKGHHNLPGTLHPQPGINWTTFDHATSFLFVLAASGCCAAFVHGNTGTASRNEVFYAVKTCWYIRLQSLLQYFGFTKRRVSIYFLTFLLTFLCTTVF